MIRCCPFRNPTTSAIPMYKLQLRFPCQKPASRRHKKIGLVLIIALAALGFIVSIVTYAIAAQLSAGNIVKSIISAILMPAITYLLAKNDIANGTIA